MTGSESTVGDMLALQDFAMRSCRVGGAQHNDADYAAWSSSTEHIHATPGWEKSSWPRPMTLDEAMRDAAPLLGRAAANVMNLVRLSDRPARDRA